MEESTDACEGKLEALNGVAPSTEGNRILSWMQLSGWTTISGKDGIVPDAVLVRIESRRGKVSYVMSEAVPRVDVARFFGSSKLPSAGFIAEVDASDLKGDYTLGISRLYKGRLERCRNFSYPITVVH
jgi:hypothetical protein